MKRGITITVAALLFLLCAAIIYIYVSIGSVIVDTVEARGTAITQTTVTLEEADFSPSTGLTTLLRMKVENPKGFADKTGLSFDRIELWIDPETLGSDVIIVKSLALVAPEISYEIAAPNDNLRTLKSYIDHSANADTDGPRIVIENFQVRNGVIVVTANNLRGQRRTAQLADIQMQNIGKSEGGLAPAQAISIMLEPILRNTTLAALETDLKLSDQARNVLNGALDETNKALKTLKDLLK
ncbi:MAG: hypothetical protein MI743_07915 [Sneathiellales bacterium]|nr:hypothetical protein [Sneathiellales bacterium]